VVFIGIYKFLSFTC